MIGSNVEQAANNYLSQYDFIENDMIMFQENAFEISSIINFVQASIYKRRSLWYNQSISEVLLCYENSINDSTG